MSEPPVAGHLDLDGLADALAGLRADDPHLRTCAACADRLAELAAAEVAVVASLATLPDPALPEGLPERLAAALRAETASAGSVTPLRSSVRQRRRQRARAWLPTAAAGLVLVLAAGLGLALLGDQPLGSSSGSDSSAGAGSGLEAGGGGSAEEAVAEFVVAASGVDYADPAQRAAALRSVLVPAASEEVADSDPAPPRMAVPLEPASDQAAPDDAAPEQAAPDQATQNRAAAEALDLPPASSSMPSSASSGELERLSDPRALAECVAALPPADVPEPVLVAVDHASYRGAPALALVQDDGQPGSLLLTVVRPTCSRADAGVLERARVDRP